MRMRSFTLSSTNKIVPCSFIDLSCFCWTGREPKGGFYRRKRRRPKGTDFFAFLVCFCENSFLFMRIRITPSSTRTKSGSLGRCQIQRPLVHPSVQSLSGRSPARCRCPHTYLRPVG